MANEISLSDYDLSDPVLNQAGGGDGGLVAALVADASMHEGPAIDGSGVGFGIGFLDGFSPCGVDRGCGEGTSQQRVLANIQSDVNLVDMIANSSIEFNVRDCLEFVAAVSVGDGWACYAWGFKIRNFTLIDPSAHGMSVEDVKNKHRHAYEPLFAKLLMHASPAVRDAAWTEVIHTTVGVNCPRNSTGVFSLLAAKIVDCKTGQIALDHFDMAQCTRNMV
ncbi:hypothetical protein QYE76_016793 [Lolium multiflorum]|uniref:Uncharacterized protein n=1 Tax=Lolium multiflorum TaxID=4521 RepID=A0AAD8VC93_LOLMU|nr:hypothetical protein QYE76_016793 [Lolium multiflorum]